MAGYLTTHVLDTSRGRPAVGLLIELYRIENEQRLKISAKSTNDDGRTNGPILPKDLFEIGSFELLFYAGDYLGRMDNSLTTQPFLDIIPIRFGMSEEDHYHVPLLLSPFGYSTYRGS